jgi:hypothetical protein
VECRVFVRLPSWPSQTPDPSRIFLPAIPDRQLSEPHFATNLYERTDQKLSFFQHLTHQRELLLSMQIDQIGDVLVQSPRESQKNNPASLDEAHGGCRLANDLFQDIELFLRKRNFGGLAWHHFLRPWKTLVKTRVLPVRKTCLSCEYESGRLRRMGRYFYLKTAMA